MLLMFIPDIFADNGKSKKAGRRKKDEKALSRSDEASDPNEPAEPERAEQPEQLSGSGEEAARQ